jgi:predicted dehydrogenase
MKVIVVGFGSIGKRHVDNLISLGIKDVVLCRSKLVGNRLNLKEINNIENILDFNPNFVIISNPTALHFSILKFLIKNNINFLCEKPLVHSKEEWLSIKSSLHNYEGFAKVVFNLRFHPCIIKVKELLNGNRIGKVNFARFFVGQYLPDWRPNSNHLESYSASKEMGGGVVMDLVHEIDIAEYLLGKPTNEIKSISDKVSNVTIDSVDVSEIIYKTENNCIVNIHLDYLFKGYARNFIINGDVYNLNCDLFNNTIKISGNSNIIIDNFEFNKFDRNDMYLNLLKDYIKGLHSARHISKLPSLMENQSVMNTCFQVNNN